MRGLLGFVKDYVMAIRGSIAVRTRRLRPRARLALATVALLPALLLTTAYVLGLDGDGAGPDSDARHRPHAVGWPDSSGSDAGDAGDAGDSSPRASTEPGGDQGTDPAGSDAGDDPTLPGGQDGDEQIVSGPGPEDPTSQPWPGGSLGNKSAPGSVEGPAPAAPTPSTTATTAPPTTSAPGTTGPSTTTTTTLPPSGDPPPDEGEGGLLGDLTDGLLDTVTGLL